MVYSFGSASTHNATVLETIRVANAATNGVFIFGFLVAVFAVQSIMLNRNGVGTLGCIAISSWLCFLYSAVLVVMGDVLTLYVAIGFLIVSGLSTLVLAKQN